MNITIIGAGRAGTSFAAAWAEAGHEVSLVHHDEPTVHDGTDVILLCVPDDALSDVARSLPASPTRVVAHCAGSRTLDVLAPHPRVGSLHPLVALPDATIGAARLRAATYCVAGDDLVRDLVASLGGRSFSLRDDQRAAYHATACVAANHLVTLLGHVERLANAAGLELAELSPAGRERAGRRRRGRSGGGPHGTRVARRSRHDRRAPAGDSRRGARDVRGPCQRGVDLGGTPARRAAALTCRS